ncbi:cell division FtsA domain-containing protein [Halalkalibacter nanhaiisediminis]|uniref:Cell division protein FtsA n=1 Tax=Halalkalibacter nanhaiisediminis TaxID=688079 RepID=A0A562QJP6_9BACI|nr:cell division FtsA domain-containing protein [Halalkalibacter nanhaiisediminis]TWI56935.1 cell division protein FtsA [Halalkalibacter nanhaiisediminis]
MSTEHPSPLFALDIGTRSVVGLLLRQNNEKFEIMDSIIKEHDKRTMLDGQIHDVPSVAAVIREVKDLLEERHGPLTKVCVAAAGRSLKTRRAQFDVDISAKPMFDRDDVLHLELSAVQQAQFQLANEPEDNAEIDYYCVGYSVLAYSLDQEPIGSLLDQTGKLASVEVIATFLPKVVVESLLAALARADLELEALTLEPIAAINVLIPPSMRRLNVALVDIGAGTSDIALTDENTVIAYGMVPIAGDEVTEAISDHFLLDFPDAERVKRELSTHDTVQITDILGMETTLGKEEVISPITNTISKLARSISDEIILLNGKAPKAVMLVGGGSLTPLLVTHVAEYLGLPENRVAIRGADAIKLLQTEEDQEYGPELVTPIGIAIAAKENPIEYISIRVNERTLRLFDVKKLTVGDGLLAAGIDIAKLYGKPGLAIMVTVFDQLISIPGEYGEPPTLLKNKQPTSLDAPLDANDELIVERGKHGKHAVLTIAELIGDIPSLSITINEKSVHIPATVLKNGKTTRLDAFVNERDHITITQSRSVKDVLALENIPISLFEPLYVMVNEERWTYEQKGSNILVNGQLVGLHHQLVTGDVVQLKTNQISNEMTIAELLETKNFRTHLSVTIFYNNEPISIEKTLVEVKRGQEFLTIKSSIQHQDQLTLTTKKDQTFILQDIFTAIDINITELTGKRVSLKRNGEDTTFSSPLLDGDKIELSIGDSLHFQKE